MPQEITLRTLLRDHPKLFYRQEWYRDEPFMDEVACSPLAHDRPPTKVWTPTFEQAGCPQNYPLPPAVDLVALFVRFPGAQCWNDYLWTNTFDRQGQRVYVGGCSNGNGFEIHRHLHLSERWGVPTWE